MGRTPRRARTLPSFFACAFALVCAPASAQQRVDLDLGIAQVAAGPAGTSASLSAGPVGAQVTADPSGIGADLSAGPAQADVKVPTPAVTPPATPAVPDPGGATGPVNDIVGNVPPTGAGGTDPNPAQSGGGSGSSGGGGGSPGGTDAPRGSSSRGTDRSGSGGSDGGGRSARGRDRGTGGDTTTASGPSGSGSDVGSGSGGGSDSGSGSGGDSGGSGVTGALERVVEVIPTQVWAALIALALLALAFFGRGQVVSRRARRLAAQREELLHDVGLLQQALLPEIPEKLGELATTVAYRPADGPAAGGDFYDAFLLDGERVAIIVGDVSGHGRAALARTALMRYTLRAYLDAGLEPRRALKVAGRALDDDLGGDFATVVVAIHDPAHATLTYSSAGHPPPIVTGSGAFEPVTALSSPPIGAGLPTGQRQTTLHLPGDAVACFFTDGLVEAKMKVGLLGRERLSNLLGDLGPDVTAARLIDAVVTDAESTPDDMAACVLRPDATGAADHIPDRVEEVELNPVDIAGDRVERYLAACGVSPEAASAAVKSVEASVVEFGGALLRVRVEKTRIFCEVESAAGLYDPLGAPPEMDDAPARV
jgi:serine phosphatase RsbU (regulator of sigma subunit)